MKKNARPLCLLLAVIAMMILSLCLFACDGGTPAETAAPTAAPTDAPTEAATAAPATEPPATEAPTTEAATEAVTEAPTEAPTEAETLPPEAPTDSAVLTFCDTPLNSLFLDPNSATAYEIVTDGTHGPVLKLTTVESDRLRDPYIKIDYAAYMAAADLEPVAWNDCAFAVFLVRLEGVRSTKLEMAAYNKSGEKTKNVRGSGTYKLSNTDWQYVFMPLVDKTAEGSLTELRLDFVDNPGAAGVSVYLASVSFVGDKLTALQMMGTQLINPGTATVEIPGLDREYTFLHVTDSHVSAFSDGDAASWTAARLSYNTARRASFAADGLLAEERFPLFFDYADELGADGLFLTGDLIDFPSEKNISILYENVNRTKAKSVFCLGNHDWNYSDDYMTGNSVATNRPLFGDLTGGDPYFSYAEYEHFIVAAVDNSSDVVTDDTVNKFLALYEKNKPIILLLHVPLHADTLAPDVKKAWGGRNITMGPGAMGSDWGSVQTFYNAVCVDESSPVVAVFAGHVHFNHEDVFPNGVPQYVTSTGYTGDCRVVTVKPAP